MRLSFSSRALFLLSLVSCNDHVVCGAFLSSNNMNKKASLKHRSSSPFIHNTKSLSRNTAKLFVSIGLGPEKQKDEEETEKELVPGVDYEVPDHESFRTSRRSKIDEKSDQWFGTLLHSEKNGILGELAENAKEILLSPVPLVNEEPKPLDHEEWTPYVTTKLPWTPLTPAYGLEEYGLPTPRRNAEAWKHFDVVGMVEQDYSSLPDGTGTELSLAEEQVEEYKAKLREKGGWLGDDDCSGRLVYINGRFVPQLSKTSNDVHVENIQDIKSTSDDVKSCLARLTDGFTDELATPVPINEGEYYFTSLKKLSGPDHAVGEPTSQFAINTQQGTACFAALNTKNTGAVAYIHVPSPETSSSTNDDDKNNIKPVIVINAVTNDGGATGEDVDTGVTYHPRTLVIADEGSRLSVVQSSVDLDEPDDSSSEKHRAKLHNGYTQFFVKGGANITHSYLHESGGMVTSGVEQNDDDIEEGMPIPREVESKRPALKDTHLEAVDVHVTGENGAYEGTLMSLGGNGRIRIALSVSLLCPGAEAIVNGFSLSGGAQRTDMKTNIHHVADGTKSCQIQKNMIGGRATGSFRGRIRVEQSAQQTDSEQLSRSILLSDRSRAWAVPSLEIIADDVKCTHGATVSDLSEEELFYLRSRGLSRTVARNLLMYAFAGDISTCVEPSMLGTVDSGTGLQHRVIRRLENLVPKGDRAVKGEFQSV